MLCIVQFMEFECWHQLRLSRLRRLYMCLRPRIIGSGKLRAQKDIAEQLDAGIFRIALGRDSTAATCFDRRQEYHFLDDAFSTFSLLLPRHSLLL